MAAGLPVAALGLMLASALAMAGTLTPALHAQSASAPVGSAPTAPPAVAPPPAVPSQAAAPADSSPTLKPSPMVQMRSLEPAEDEEYTLGGGDEITVEVPGHPELSGKHTVGPDGRITLPTAGVVNLNGLTRDQASDAVRKTLAQYYRDPSASISIDKYGSNRVMVMGAVQKPGYVYFQATPTLLDAITQAGLIQPTGPPGVQTVSTSGGKQPPPMMPQECIVYEGRGDDQKVVTVNINKLMTTGNGLADLRLRRDAVVYVQNPRDRFVSVLGEVTRPGPVVLTDNLNLAEIIGLAGGLTEKSGNNPTIAIVDPTTRKVRYIKYKDVISPEAMNEVSLQPGDLVVVPKAGLAKLGYVFQQIGPITGLASIFALSAF